MALQVYRRKRKFDVTPEPRGRKAKGRGGNRYVIQKHAATRLHYDLRLELDGVMKSWAVTRGPSLVPSEKRLAVHVEDHPIEYNKFEGTIPKGEYGGGTVMIWDRGRWHPEEDPHKGYAKGHLVFTIEGQKLHGRWHLVRIKPRRGEKQDSWLLMKANDEAARTAGQPDILEEEPLSAATGRSMEEIASGKGGKKVWHSKPKGNGADRAAHRASASPKQRLAAPQWNARLAPPPAFLPPSLATLQDKPPSSSAWIHEVKFDGYRLQARLDRGKVTLKTRTGLDWTSKFSTVAAALSALPVQNALIDGEVVVENADGVSDFSALQDALKHRQPERMAYYAFDLMYLDGVDLTRCPQIERKQKLAKLLKNVPQNGTLRYSEHFEDDGAVVLKHACQMHLEGIISKQRGQPYRSGRSDAWIKTKCLSNQEFVIAGYESSTKSGRDIRSLILGYFEDGALHYAGRVGTGFSVETERNLAKKLSALQVKTVPFGEVPEAERRRKVHWVKPTLVAEIDFRGWTSANILRQASFQGLREDKPAREIVREVPAGTGNPTKAKKSAVSASASSNPGAGVEIAHVRISHPDRIYWADANVTKRELAEYYVGVWDWIAPHLVNRPLALLRCPEGTAGECFFQKHIAAGIKNSALRHRVNAKEKDVIVVEKLDDLISLVQSGVLEIHVRGSTLGALELCDRIVFDLDPGDGVRWPQMVDAAREVRERLASLKLESFVKLSGGKGLHVVLPIKPTDWDSVKIFSQAVAMAMAADDPKRYVAKMTKSLRDNRVFVDYLRNSREATSVAAYSSRARAGAPVSAPVTWQELARTDGAAMYTVLNLEKRLARLKADPWAELPRLKQKLPDVGKRNRQ